MTYRHVLNSAITDAVARGQAGEREGDDGAADLFDSQIGASFWTAREKDTREKRKEERKEGGKKGKKGPTRARVS